MNVLQEFFPGAELGQAESHSALARAPLLQRFEELVLRLGGDLPSLCAPFNIEPAQLRNRHAELPYRAVIGLLERAASELACPDFGMRLAVLQCRGLALGPLHVAMRNSPTLGHAVNYCIDHLQASNTGAQMVVDELREEGAVMVRYEVLLSRTPWQRQAVEHAVALFSLHLQAMSGGRVRPREVCFTNPPLADPAAYRAHIGCPARFGANANGVILAESDLAVEVTDADPWLYELANNFIEQRYPMREPPLTARVRSKVERLLLEGECSFVAVAAMLGMHPRTLQRRLRAEGESFESIKDSVRRDVALRYLCQSEMPLTRIAELLGYSETSVLSRSCYRWFSASPRQLRSGRAVPANA